MCASGVSSIVTLPRQTGNEDDFFYETLGLGSKEFSFYHTRDSHSTRRDFVHCPYSDSRSVGILFQETRL
jgi:hypothetical protein